MNILEECKDNLPFFKNFFIINVYKKGQQYGKLDEALVGGNDGKTIFPLTL